MTGRLDQVRRIMARYKTLERRKADLISKRIENAANIVALIPTDLHEGKLARAALDEARNAIAQDDLESAEAGAATAEANAALALIRLQEMATRTGRSAGGYKSAETRRQHHAEIKQAYARLVAEGRAREAAGMLAGHKPEWPETPSGIRKIVRPKKMRD